MKILIVSWFYPPRNSAGSLRPYSWAKYWTREGHDVTVLTPVKDEDPATALRLPDPGCALHEVPVPAMVSGLKRIRKRMTDEPRGGKSHRRLGLSQLVRRAACLIDRQRARFGILGAGPRLPDVADAWALGALNAATAHRPWDVVVSSATPYVVHVIAAKLKQRGLARRWIADYRDLWNDHHTKSGLPLLRAWESRFENRLLRTADAITTVSDPLADMLRRRHGTARVHVIKNGFDADDFEHLDPAPVFPRDGRRRVVYTGTIYDQQNPSPLLHALTEMAHEPEGARLLRRIEVVVATRTPSRIAELVRRLSIDNWVRVVGFVPRPLALRMQRDADLLLFLPWNDPTVDGILTAKVYEYLFSGTPILLVGCPVLEASQRLILEAGRGIRLPDVAHVKAFLADFLRGSASNPTPPPRVFLDRYDRRRLALELLSLAPAPERQDAAGRV